jgi:hypothetical protein
LDFVVPSIFRDLGSFLKKQKGQRVAKTAKRFFFVLFCHFLPFLIPKKERYHKIRCGQQF